MESVEGQTEEPHMTCAPTDGRCTMESAPARPSLAVYNYPYNDPSLYRSTIHSWTGEPLAALCLINPLGLILSRWPLS